MNEGIVTNFISDDELSNIASTFLMKHGKSGQSPVDIEKICDDEDVGLLIVPDLPSLKDIEAFIANECEVIVIDQGVFETQIDRARFSIAHELSHRILHSTHLEKFPINDLGSYEKFHSAVSTEDLTMIEDQAYSLAGHLLMPTDLLNKEIDKLLSAQSSSAVIDDAMIERIIRALAATFMVSVDALLRQVEKVNRSFYSQISKESLKILVPPYVKSSPSLLHTTPGR